MSYKYILKLKFTIKEETTVLSLEDFFYMQKYFWLVSEMQPSHTLAGDFV